MNSDYFMRQVEGFTDLLSTFLLGRTTEPEEIVHEQLVSTGDHNLLIDLRFLIARGQLNEAENRLFRYLEAAEGGGAGDVADQFYRWLEDLDDARLAACAFPREEIAQGRRDALALLRRDGDG